jgi:hypothetical protein
MSEKFRLQPSDIAEETIEEIEDAVGCGHSAWDCANVRDIIAAVVNVFLSRGEREGYE